MKTNSKPLLNSAAGSLLAVLVFATSNFATISGTDKAWGILNAALAGNTDDRTHAVSVLALIPGDAKVLNLATGALDDPRPEVRVAACNSLGALDNKAAIPSLQKAVADDKEMSVIVACAHALHALKDNSAYEIYYAILTGEVKDSASLITKQLDTLKDPRQLAKIGFEQGIGFIPFAGAGWSAFRAIRRSDPSPVRAAAARALATDPDPKSGEALVNATQDNNWVVRVAALEALSHRGDPTLRVKVEPAMNDRTKRVRFTAAAVVIHLSELKKTKPARRGPTR